MELGSLNSELLESLMRFVEDWVIHFPPALLSLFRLNSAVDQVFFCCCCCCCFVVVLLCLISGISCVFLL